MTRPTRAQLAWTVSELVSLCHQLHGCYANDVQPNRAEAMEALLAKVEPHRAILDRMPFDEIQSGRPT